MTDPKLKTRKVDGAALCPAPTLTRTDDVITMWCGLRPEVQGIEAVDVAGVHFPRAIRDKAAASGELGPLRTGVVQEVPVKKLSLLVERLPRRILRRTGADLAPPPGASDVSDEDLRQSRGAHLVVIPSEEEIAAGERSNHPVRPYVPARGDIPLAHAIYCVPVANGKRWPDEEPPPSIAETGIELPGEPDVEVIEDDAAGLESLFASE